MFYPYSMPQIVTDLVRPLLLVVLFVTVTSFAAANEACFECHNDSGLTGEINGAEVSMFVSSKKFSTSVHKDLKCTECHVDAKLVDDEHPETLKLVSCAECHEDEVDAFEHSAHARSKTQQGPNCVDCHGKHDIVARSNPLSPVYPLNAPKTCGSCHGGNGKGKTHTFEDYIDSLHGDALINKGLIVSATCVDCHGGHRILHSDNPESSTHHARIAQTCTKCHVGIADIFKTSIHAPHATDADKNLKKPSCSTCHQAHKISSVKAGKFRHEAVTRCVECHEEVADTYLDSFHGKAGTLGDNHVAMCHDCHGSHNILTPADSRSTLHQNNRVNTCAKCHEGANANFSEFKVHADYMDREKEPFLFYTFFAMTSLLVGTFIFFGLHTFLWLPRIFMEKRAHAKKHHETPSGIHIKRFDPFSRFLHLLIILSFITLAITGMTLKFSHSRFFQELSHLLGGYQVTGYLHRIAAIVSFTYFFLHIGQLLYRKRKEKWTLKWMLFGSSTLVPNFGDLKDFLATVKWFLWMGPKPAYGRWTYWEKFDYIAEFWGTMIIGFTGLVLWVPEFFTGPLGLPGIFINIATIVHSVEALLATGFIFTIHFFNTHCRPDKFPMDTVIFTGSLTLEEFKEERPREYEELVKAGRLDELKTEPPTKGFLLAVRIFGFAALGLGILTVVGIAISLISMF